VEVFLVLSFFSKVVEAQGRRLSAVLALLHRGGNEHQSGDDKGQGLVQLGGNACQPAQRAGEGHGQRGTGHPQGVEESEHHGAYHGEGGAPVGEDDQGHGNPAIAVDPAAGSTAMAG